MHKHVNEMTKQLRKMAYNKTIRKHHYYKSLLEDVTVYDWYLFDVAA